MTALIETIDGFFTTWQPKIVDVFVTNLYLYNRYDLWMIKKANSYDLLSPL